MARIRARNQPARLVHAFRDVKNGAERISFIKFRLTSKRGRLGVDGASVQHGHDLAHKVFGNEISKGQNLCADELDDLRKEDTT